MDEPADTARAGRVTRDRRREALRWRWRWTLQLIIFMVAAVALIALVMALQILVNPDYGSRLNETFLAPGEYENRVKVAQVLISIAGFSATFVAVMQGVKVIQRRRQDETLLKLAELRTSGVELRNRGSRLMTAEEREAWYNQVEAWDHSVYIEVEKLSRVAVEELRTLDTFPLRPFPEIADDARAVHRVSMLSETLRRLYDLIQRYQ